jgi:prepilin-type N-terminal cleavage/methylation domain-containing protein
MKASIHRDRRTHGFTLLELLVVISIMALLASLTLMGFRHASNQSSRNRTTATHRAIMSALENYHSDNGEYPEPRSQGQDVQFGTSSYNIAGALMLYQALSGDGSDEIKTSGGGSGSSDGLIKDDELTEAKWKEIPKEVILKTSNGWMLIDGFGHPFQYTYPQRQTGKEQGTKSSNTVNTTYDLWSFAEDDKHTEEVSLGSKQDPSISGKWIKNW